jgi:hypothetical protein
MWYVALFLTLVVADKKVHRVKPSKTPDSDSDDSELAPRGAAATAGSVAPQTPNIMFHGGPVMVNPTIHLIFYGAWNVSPDNVNNGKQIVIDFANGLGASNWSRIMTISPAYNSGSSVVTGTYANVFSADIGFNPTTSTSLTTSGITAIVQYYVQHQRNNLWDSNSIYAVITSSGVTQADSKTAAFCKEYCGWHDSYIPTGVNQNIKFLWVGNAATKCLSSCGQASGPNGNPGVDSLVSVLAHELTESTTDPLGNAWYDSNGNENADKCAWTYGGAQFLVNGASANVRIGTRSFLIQRNLATNSLCYVDGVSLQQ